MVCLPTNDSNELADSDKTASGGLALLFSLITLGFYSYYWSFKLGKKLDKNDGVAYVLLALFGFGFIVYALAQSKINELIEKREKAAQTTLPHDGPSA